MHLERELAVDAGYLTDIVAVEQVNIDPRKRRIFPVSERELKRFHRRDELAYAPVGNDRPHFAKLGTECERFLQGVDDRFLALGRCPYFFEIVLARHHQNVADVVFHQASERGAVATDERNRYLSEFAHA